MYELPSTSYREFEVSRLSGAELAYFNDLLNDMSADEVVKQGAWLVPGPDDLPYVIAENRIALAERYGGSSIGVHGGGVRCGIIDGLSVKGIGCNPLCGEGAPLDYANGGMSLSEALQEALWGEVLTIALPYGAVRALGVLNTQTKCWWVEQRWGRDLLKSRYGDDIYIPRGILVRELSVRPAHFERALFYRPTSADSINKFDDVRRVSNAINSLTCHLPAGKTAGDDSSGARERMMEMTRRMAEQSAAAKARRIVHGNIGSSNICLDGRWMDFGSVTAIPSWGNLGGYGDFWDDGKVYSEIFQMLILGQKKYSQVDITGLPTSEELMDVFTGTSSASLNREFLGLTGIPSRITDRHKDSTEAKELLRHLFRVAKAGHRLPFEGHPTSDSSFGTYRLSRILCKLVDRELGYRQDEVELSDGFNYLAPLAAAVHQFFQLCMTPGNWPGVTQESAHRFVRLTVRKLSGDPSSLYKPNLVSEVEQIISDHRTADLLCAGASDFFQSVLSECEFRYSRQQGLEVPLGRLGSSKISYIAETDSIELHDVRSRTIMSRNEADKVIKALPSIDEDERFEVLFAQSSVAAQW